MTIASPPGLPWGITYFWDLPHISTPVSVGAAHPVVDPNPVRRPILHRGQITSDRNARWGNKQHPSRMLAREMERKTLGKRGWHLRAQRGVEKTRSSSVPLYLSFSFIIFLPSGSLSLSFSTYPTEFAGFLGLLCLVSLSLLVLLGMRLRVCQAFVLPSSLQGLCLECPQPNARSLPMQERNWLTLLWKTSPKLGALLPPASWKVEGMKGGHFMVL